MAPKSARVLYMRDPATRQNRPLYLPMCDAGQPFFTYIDGFFCCRLIIWQKPCGFRPITARLPLANLTCPRANVITGRAKAGSLAKFMNDWSGTIFYKKGRQSAARYHAFHFIFDVLPLGRQFFTNRIQNRRIDNLATSHIQTICQMRIVIKRGNTIVSQC